MAFLAFLALNVFKEAYTRQNYNQTAKAQEIIFKEFKKKKSDNLSHTRELQLDYQ